MQETRTYKITLEVESDSAEGAIERVIELLNAGGRPDEILMEELPDA